MTEPSQGRKKTKITYTASSEGVEKAEKALKRLGFGSKSNFAKTLSSTPISLSRTTVTKFFQRQPIQLDSLTRICDELKLNWQEITEEPEEISTRLVERDDCSSLGTNQGVEQVQTLPRQITVLDKRSKKIKAVIVLKGTYNSISNDLDVTLKVVLRKYSGDTIEITDIKEGSIRVFIEGSEEDIKSLVSLFKSEELTEVSGFPVEDVQILSESSDDKWRKVQKIVGQGAEGEDLSDADLSDADLSGANLSGANLSGADLSDADLSGANLSGVQIDDATKLDDKWRLVWEIVNQGAKGRNLSGADLSGANLSRAVLSRADLSRADLSDANLSGALLVFANLGRADLSRADLSRADLSDADLSDANLNGALLVFANLGRALLVFANLGRADLSRANLSGANLLLADLSGSDLSGADLSGANLRRADLRLAQIDNATKLDYKWRLVWEIVNQGTKGQDLSGADLSGADLSGADLSGADLSGADLSCADLSCADLSGADLSGADLRGADLSGANLSGANLSRANLIGADLSGADLSGADLSGADLRLADLRNANLSGADLRGANVVAAQFGWNTGVSKNTMLDLERRGAIFEDPGEREPTLSSR